MEHFFETIEGWFNCEPLYKEMVQGAESGAVFVEVGAWKGRSAAFMCVEILNSGKDIFFDVVDHFKGGPEHVDFGEVVNGTLAAEFAKNMKPVEGVFRLLDTPSTEAANLHPDATVDFCYIDGSHDYDDVKADILAWLPKIKPGALLAGDDYNHFDGVKMAVDELLPGADTSQNVWRYICPST